MEGEVTIGEEVAAVKEWEAAAEAEEEWVAEEVVVITIVAAVVRDVLNVGLRDTFQGNARRIRNRTIITILKTQEIWAIKGTMDIMEAVVEEEMSVDSMEILHLKVSLKQFSITVVDHQCFEVYLWSTYIHIIGEYQYLCTLQQERFHDNASDALLNKVEEMNEIDVTGPMEVKVVEFVNGWQLIDSLSTGMPRPTLFLSLQCAMYKLSNFDCSYFRNPIFL